MPKARIVIPDDLQFSELRIQRTADGDVSFDPEAIARIEQASGLPEFTLRAEPEDTISGIITQWYADHLAAGGQRDAVMDDLIAEVDAEDAHGHGYSHEPGRA